jgi:outer membrane receptor protein involved in Fe transport
MRRASWTRVSIPSKSNANTLVRIVEAHDIMSWAFCCFAINFNFGGTMQLIRNSFRDFVHRNHLSVLTVLFAVLVASVLSAQIVETGVITGVVKDSSGAVVPRANVTLLNAATGLATHTITDSQGLYVSPPLTPGNYDVKVVAPGFSKVDEHVRLEVGQRLAADIALAVGAAADTVEVQATGAVLQSESSSVSNLRTEEAVKNLPLNGRNYAELVGLGAGTVPAETQISSVPYTMQRGDISFALNGLRYQENRTLLDGIGDVDNHNGLAIAIFPPIEAIQEFSEDIADADARYGRGNGGTINLIFKSGGDRYHGDAFEFLRNTALNARNFFATATKPPLRENEFGATFGGPLFPRKANPTTFFFVDYSGRRFGQGQTDVESVPDVKITTAGYDFSAYPVSIVNPATKVAYTNNFVPASDPNIDSTGVKLLEFYEQYAAPNRPGQTIANNFLYNPLYIDNENAFDAKVDQKFTDNDSAFVRYSESHDTLSEPGILPTPLVGAIICGPATNPAYQTVINETHIFSPTLVNSARVGWTRFFVNAKNWDAGLNLPTQLGIPGVDIAGVPNSDGLPVFSFAGYTTIGDAGNSPTQIGTNNYQFDDDINLVIGKHSLDFGFEFVRLEYNMYQTGDEHGAESFSTTYTGLAWSDLLFGAPTSGVYSLPSGTVGLRQSDLSFYAQDNYRVNSRLTLNLGLRYENFLGWPWTEAHNKEYDFVPSISTTALEQVGTDGILPSGLSGNNANFAPRVGFAYELTNKTVFHAGYGLYYSAPNVTNSSGLSANVPVDNYWAFNNSTTYGAATGVTPFNYTKDGFAHTVITSGSALNPNTPAFAQDPNAKTPYSEQWHATLEQQIPYSTVLKFAYVGTRGIHLDDVRDINAGQLGLAGATTVAAARPYPYFAQINQLETRQKSSYNALQVTGERRAHGVNFLASYTYSHALDEGTGSPGGVLNPYNIAADYGNSDMDIPNRFVASATYALPFKNSGPLKRVVEGWEATTILQYYDGFPFSVSSSKGVGDSLTPRAQFIGTNGGNGSLPSGQRSLKAWFNTLDFGNPTAGTWGDSGRNILQGPGTKDVDFSVIKDTHISESKVLQVRAEFFNLFNTPQFNNPATTVGTGTFGTVSSAGSEPVQQRLERNIQLATKFTF